jgi:hypothetical protein
MDFVLLLISRTTLSPGYYRTTKEDSSLTQDCVNDGYYPGYFSLRVHLLFTPIRYAYVSYLTAGSDSEQRRIGRLIFRLMFLASSGSSGDAAGSCQGIGGQSQPAVIAARRRKRQGAGITSSLRAGHGPTPFDERGSGDPQ